jgi:selenocysteine lyase/cysteine desulfurase
MVSISFYKIFGPNRIGALAARRTALDIITAHPLINTSLLESDLTHGGT